MAEKLVIIKSVINKQANYVYCSIDMEVQYMDVDILLERVRVFLFVQLLPFSVLYASPVFTWE